MMNAIAIQIHAIATASIDAVSLHGELESVFVENRFVSVITKETRMTKLVDKIERIMRKADPLRLDGAYYFDAQNLVQLLRTWPHDDSASIRELCEQAFYLYLFDKGYDYDVDRWLAMVAEIRWLIEKLRAEKRMKKIRSQLLTSIIMKKIRGELLATAMAPGRIASMIERHGASSPSETFA
jgi:hypothetical protein